MGMINEFILNIPSVTGSGPSLTARSGDVYFVLGANGTGKSSLLQFFHSQNSGRSKKISAHRQSFFQSDSIDLSPHARKQGETALSSYDAQIEARYRDSYSAQRSAFAIYDLMDAENVRAREITKLVDERNMKEAKNLSKIDAPIKVINELLKLSNIPITLTVASADQVHARRNGSPPYSMARLSDGERNALLICAEVLTSKAHTLILIDEPERHLHRSIISPLLTALFKKRPDCAFVVSTHDILLPLDNPRSATLLVRSCQYNGDYPQSWDADFLAPSENIHDQVKQDILGARREILFVEGDQTSIDLPLYATLFPMLSVIAKGSCRDVISYVSSIRGSEELHWIKSRGIVDSDNRSAKDKLKLTSNGIFPVPFYSVESIYFHPKMIKRLAAKQTSVIGGEAKELTAEALSAAMKSLNDHKDRLIEKKLIQQIRECYLNHIPGKESIASNKPFKVEIDILKIANRLTLEFDNAVNSGDFAALAAAYPIRETPAVANIVSKLQFSSRSNYESALLKLLMEDASALKEARMMFKELSADIGLL